MITVFNIARFVFLIGGAIAGLIKPLHPSMAGQNLPAPAMTNPSPITSPPPVTNKEITKAGIGIKCVLRMMSECPSNTVDQSIVGETDDGQPVYAVMIRHHNPDAIRQLQQDGVAINSIMDTIATARISENEIRDLLSSPSVERVDLSRMAYPTGHQSDHH